ncbi:MAG: metallophosphoesterase family protein [Candidatus Hydrogenedentes bacterium]|nr:metallophosphoesterase family protein [Candidatus Hydrogenedentota bacterium]
MLIAVIGGIHGYAGALEAALARIAAQGIHTVLCTGNVAVGGPNPNEAIGLLRDCRVTCVQGASDRLAVRALRKAESMKARMSEEDFGALQRAHDVLTSANLEFLRSLPRSRTIEIEEFSLYLCHGTVASQADSLHEGDSADRFRRQREAANTDIVVCGSDGPAFTRWIDQTLLVNPGTLATDDGASFYLVNTEAEPFNAEIHRA